MTLVIGIDEAGYGPNLGPLVVAATVWRVSAQCENVEELLGIAIAEALAAAHPTTTPAGRANGSRPLWADSKLIYRGGEGFADLERGVMAGLSLVSLALPTNWAELIERVGSVGPSALASIEWQGLESLTLPRVASSDDCLAVAARLRVALTAHSVCLVRVACSMLYPADFNLLLDAGLNKSDILSQTTLSLAATLRGLAPDEPALIFCDRHGGRKSYASLVAHHFKSPLVRSLEETAARSAYEIARDHCQIEFCVGGESRAPVALASMTAKYLRELSMQAFNTFWSARVPGLLPTAGYPLDARRWRREADAAIQFLGIDAEHLWRRV